MSYKSIKKVFPKNLTIGISLLAISLQPVYAVFTDNTVGRITGRPILIIGKPLLSGPGWIDTKLAPSLPSVSDADADQVVDWNYKWMVDGAGTYQSAGSPVNVPSYSIKLSDVGKSISLCLQAVADVGYPITTKTSEESCSVTVVGEDPYASAQLFGVILAGDTRKDMNIGSSDLINLRCGDVVDAIGTPELGLVGGTGGTPKSIVASKVRKIDLNWGNYVGGPVVISKMVFTLDDSTVVTCGANVSVSNLKVGSYSVPVGSKLYGIFTSGTNFTHAMKFVSI